jgi:hypothetical protein
MARLTLSRLSLRVIAVPAWGRGWRPKLHRRLKPMQLRSYASNVASGKFKWSLLLLVFGDVKLLTCDLGCLLVRVDGPYEHKKGEKRGYREDLSQPR